MLALYSVSDFFFFFLQDKWPQNLQRQYYSLVGEVSYLEIATAVTAAGSLLSLRSNAVCMVSLLRNISWRCHRKPETHCIYQVKHTYLLSQQFTFQRKPVGSIQLTPDLT